MEPLSRESLRIVHVDDDADFTEMGQRQLKRAGFSQPIVRCADGFMAIDYFSTLPPEEAPHVLLVDLHMPRVNGLGVLHWIRTTYTEMKIAVYLLTSSDDPSVISRRFADGGAEYVPKQVKFDYLIQKLDELIISINSRNIIR